MSRWQAVYRFAWLILAALFVVGVLCVFIPKCNSLHTMQQKQAELEEENARIEKRTQKLVENQRRFKTDPTFVERIAHESDRIKSNETVFLFPPDAD